MYITRYTDYSLRVLIYLAIRTEGLSTINDIASSYQISKNHLMKIVQDLNIRGYVLATRGKNGGLKLNLTPDEINIGKLVRALEDESKLVECFGENNQCVITPGCQLKKVFAEALECFFASLEQYSLRDLLGNSQRRKMANLLAIEIPKI